MTPAVIAATMWLMVSLAFILNSLEAPRWLIRIPVAVLVAEFLFTIIAGYRADCEGGPCAETQGLHGAPYAAIVYVLPTLAITVTLYAVAYGLRHWRTERS